MIGGTPGVSASSTPAASITTAELALRRCAAAESTATMRNIARMRLSRKGSGKGALPEGQAARDYARDAARGNLQAATRLAPRPEAALKIKPMTSLSSAGSQDYVGDPRNDDVFISVNGELTPRADAKVSVFDSGFVLGDGVWEGLRLIDGRIAFLDKHLNRLWAGAKMLRIDIGLTREKLTQRLFDVIDANSMRDGVHIRLMVTRGVKRSPYQDPRLTIGAATIVIIPEWKVPRPEMLAKGLDLFTVHIRRTGPAEQDQKLNSHSKLNCILACIQAMEAGADEALMLDDRGFVATCNSTHFFIVRDGEVWTSAGGYCLGGITRDAVLRAARRAGIPAYEKDFSLFDVYSADEAFCTGTFAGLTPVRKVDGRRDRRRAIPPRLAVTEAARALQGAGARGSAGARDEAAVRIAMWSGPRNISTAMMRAFGAARDCAVSDEPFYAAYLTATGLIHPLRDEVMRSQPTDWRAVADALIGPVPRASRSGTRST